MQLKPQCSLEHYLFSLVMMSMCFSLIKAIYGDGLREKALLPLACSDWHLNIVVHFCNVIFY
jgi:hypothetical protein